MNTNAEVTPIAETVKMQDGRSVEFAGKRRLLKETLVADGAVSVRFDFRNGQTRVFNLSDAPVDVQLRCAGHGAEQKIGDQLAGYKDGSDDDWVLEVEQMIDRLNKGEWNVKREGGGFAGQSILFQALCEISSKTPEEIKATLAGLTQAQKIALRQTAKLKPIVERLEAERTSKSTKVDGDALLEGVI